MKNITKGSIIRRINYGTKGTTLFKHYTITSSVKDKTFGYFVHYYKNDNGKVGVVASLKNWELVDTGSGDLVSSINDLLPRDKGSASFNYSERDIDFAYLCGVFNVSGIEGLHKEIQRLKAIGKDPHDIIEACRKQAGI